MLVSLKNIKEFVNLDGLTPEQIAHGLTFAGIEVEEISRLASGTKLVIGQIIECENHPNSDHLHILKVDLGEKYGIQQIVCGAPNARKDLKVIVATVGAKLPEIEIKAGVIRGVESNGMCCSLLELGVDAKYLSDAQKSGIEELPNDAPVGEEDVLGYLGLDDVVLNLNILANRPDLLSIYNVAREIAAIFEKEVKLPTFENHEEFVTDIKVSSITRKCSQFSAKEIKNIVTKPSPKWLVNTLTALGVRSINNIVDIGNYVMLMTGQPLHMYDADKLQNKELCARDDFEGDFIALDEKTYQIQNSDIVITSGDQIGCLGGVMGSLSCAVDENTKNIYIESASFDGASIRRTSNRLGLVSESSQRFVKGTNHFQAEYVLNFAAKLIKDLCEAEKESNIVTYQEETYSDKKLSSSVYKINNRLGTSFSFEQIENVLTRLHFIIESEDKENFIATVPVYRLDVTCDADLSEEVIRVLGFAHVNSVLPRLDTKYGGLTLAQSRKQAIRNYLLATGLDECVTYSLVNKKEINSFNLLKEEEGYVLLNPLTDDRSHFRTHILHSLLKVATYNVARQNKNLALFETSNVISTKSENTNLAIVLVGEQLNQGLLNKSSYDFYSIKGLLTGIMDTLGIEQSRYKFERNSKHLDLLHPGKSAEMYFQNQLVARFGELHPNQIAEYGLGKTNAVVLEMNLDLLLNAKVSLTKMTPISKFPTVSRDLAFVIAKDIQVKDLIVLIKKVGKGLVKSAEVFDVYEGEHVGEGKKSIAISISYLSEDHTLTEKEVTDAEDAIKFELTKTFKAELRG